MIYIKYTGEQPKLWIDILTTSSTIPTNSSQDITVTVLFTENDSVQGNIDDDYNKTKFFISVIGGTDFLITVEAEYMGSCFGASLHDLTKILGAPTCQNKRLSTRALESGLSIDIPKPLYLMLEFISNKANTPDLFEVCSNEESMQAVRYALDTNNFNQNFNIHSVCNALIEFLENLPYPMIEIQNFDNAIMSQEENKLGLFYDRIDSVIENSLKYFLKFGKKLIHTDNRYTYENFSGYFLDPLTHIEKISADGYRSNVSIQERRDFLKFLIEHS